MHKSEMSKLVESMVAEIVTASNGTFDASGARALLGAQLRTQRAALVTAALPGSRPAQADPRDLPRIVNGTVVGPV